MEEITKAKSYLEEVMDNIEAEKYYGKKMPPKKIEELSALFTYCSDMVKYLEPQLSKLIKVKTMLNNVTHHDN